VLPLTVAELNAYLIIPIQRICRYPILLDVSATTFEFRTHPNHSKIVHAHRH